MADSVDPPSSGLDTASEPSMTANQLTPEYVIAIHDDDQFLVGIRPDGTLQYGDSYQPDEAARVFWETLADHHRAPEIGQPLYERITTELTQGQQAGPQLAEFENVLTAVLAPFFRPGRARIDAVWRRAPLNAGCAVLHTDQQGRPVPCPGQHPDPEPDTPSEGHPEPPPEQTEEQQLRDRLEVAEYTLQRVREALGTETLTPTEARVAELETELVAVDRALAHSAKEYARELGHLRDRAVLAEARVGALEDTLEEVLREFVHETHPGERCLQTGHVRVATIDRWRAVLKSEATTP